VFLADVPELAHVGDELGEDVRGERQLGWVLHRCTWFGTPTPTGGVCGRGFQQLAGREVHEAGDGAAVREEVVNADLRGDGGVGHAGSSAGR
jgi:hypothetical protein